MRLSAMLAKSKGLWILALWVCLDVAAAPMELTIPGAPFPQHAFFHELLKESLASDGQKVTLNSVKDLPQSRAYAMLEAGELSIFWGLQTKERDAKFVRIGNRLTNGLYGSRVAFVRRGQENMFQKVRTVADLQQSGLVAGFGQIWYDVEVWKANGLKTYTPSGDWRVLFGMVAAGQRGIDYFPRSILEIVDEAANRPSLAIEPHVLMTYNHDAFYYLSQQHAHLKPLIEKALASAESSGLKERLIKKHFGHIRQQLNLDKRVVLTLKNP